MASSSNSSLLSMILVFSVLFLQIFPSDSLSCSSLKFPGNRTYDNCNELPHLSSFLYWTYDSSNSSLKIAFLTTPAKRDGWIAWAINPTKPAMLGSQALIAYEEEGKMTVKTFNVSSYMIAPSKIAYEVSDMEAVYFDGTMFILATIALPTKTTTINQVWQVGGAVVNGTPAVHAKLPENLKSMGTLDLTMKTQSQTGGGDSTLTKKNGISIFSIFACFWFIFAY